MCDCRFLSSSTQQLIARSFMCIHFLNLQDGSPHPSLFPNVIEWELPPRVILILKDEVTMTSSRIMSYFFHGNEELFGTEGIWKIVVWNWKTRDVVRFCCSSSHALLTSSQLLDLSSIDGSGLVGKGTQAIFLDEFRVAIIPDKSATAELVVFNTLIPQGHPGHLQRLAFPPEFRGKRANIRIDHGWNTGTLNRDEVLLLDPAQAVLIMELGGRPEPLVLLVIRIQALIEQTYSTRADLSVPLDEWGRNAAVISVPTNHSRILYTFIHGAQVIFVQTSIFGRLDLRGGYHVRTFDFSWRGRGSLPLRGGAGGTKRMLQFEDGVYVRFEPDDSIDPWDVLQSSNDGSLIHLVSYPPPQSIRSEIVGLCHSNQKLSNGVNILQVWELR